MVSPVSSNSTGWSLSSRISSTSVATWASEPRAGRLRASSNGSTWPWRSEVWSRVSADRRGVGHGEPRTQADRRPRRESPGHTRRKRRPTHSAWADHSTAAGRRLKRSLHLRYALGDDEHAPSKRPVVTVFPSPSGAVMRRLRLLTGGESHGPRLTAILEGLPAGLPVSHQAVDGWLARRQHGFGRGGRQRIEHDVVEVTGGLRDGRTLGSPLVLNIVEPRLEELVGGDGPLAHRPRAGLAPGGHRPPPRPRRSRRRLRHRSADRHAQRAGARVGPRDRGPGGRRRRVRPAAHPLRGSLPLGGAPGGTAPDPRRSPRLGAARGSADRLSAGHPAARR